MRKVVNSICSNIGAGFSVFTPVVNFLKSLKIHFYSGYKRRAFKSIGKNVVICPWTTYVKGGEIGDNCIFGHGLWIAAVKRFGKEEYNPTLKIGNNCTFGNFNHIAAINSVRIGNGVLTGQFVLIEDHAHASIPPYLQPSVRQLVSKGEIIIGDNVWLGDRVSIVAGVTIGEGSVIGANSVVTHDIPPFSVAVGSPAKVIKTLKAD